MQLKGIHHLTAVSADAPGNYAFYTRTLGLRLVKKTVNQDQTEAYHLFYADAEGSPGTDITFFDFPAPPERRGSQSIVRTAFRVAGAETLRWWEERFQSLGVVHSPVEERDGRLTLDFEDHEGQRLALVDDGGAGDAHPWDRSPVPLEHQIRGLGPITISIRHHEPTEVLLTRVMGMVQVRSYEHDGVNVLVYSMGPGGAGAELHVAVEPDRPQAQPGAGGVHHVAFRVDDADYDDWAQHLASIRLPNSGPVDRYYFRSLYFREPNGILFELASDGPGFATDEPKDAMGESLALPPFLEPQREQIERRLKPLDTKL
ncbi:ring-cleaving dioxygenase [Aquisalimonas asiatica]|uniref:Glyoxalase family protein n=1 Tax=Aquisalimonas asiatica TaxID=406100 RepID=A0A1H8V6P4_9GAMM|nr:ring-cleaving dioxygenase [Aquisalimonas asiatica]SEP11142.1 glyoxalase family protein [Aquisalimonas asiatica]